VCSLGAAVKYYNSACRASALIPVCSLDIFLSSEYTGLSSVLTGQNMSSDVTELLCSLAVTYIQLYSSTAFSNLLAQSAAAPSCSGILRHGVSTIGG
jgi:hypothetical protein